MNTRVPSLNWLRVFEAAARTESFARAATQLNMTPAAVSQQVKALETRLGTPLFHRHAHAVTLTETGRAYLPSVQQSLLMLETATAGLFGETREQRLYVQSVLLFAHGILAGVFPIFRRRILRSTFRFRPAMSCRILPIGSLTFRSCSETPRCSARKVTS